jgi:hypothetical protein
MIGESEYERHLFIPTPERLRLEKRAREILRNILLPEPDETELERQRLERLKADGVYGPSLEEYTAAQAALRALDEAEEVDRELT